MENEKQPAVPDLGVCNGQGCGLIHPTSELYTVLEFRGELPVYLRLCKKCRERYENRNLSRSNN